MDKVLKLSAIAACASVAAATGCGLALGEETWANVVCVGNADGTGTPLSIPNTGYRSDLRPALSATGAAVAWWGFWVTEDGQGGEIGHREIYVAAASAAASPIELTARGNAWGRYPAISDDGARVAWVGGDADQSYDIFIGAADGATAPVRITGASDYGTAGPTLSGDATKVAWTHYTSTGAAAEADAPTWVADDVWSANADGSGSPLNVTHSTGRDQDPSLSRDGTMIAWASDRNGNLEIYVGSADGTGSPVNVSNDPGDDDEPRLSSNGATVAWRAKELDGPWRVRTASAEGATPSVELSESTEEMSRPSVSADGALVAWAEDHGDRATVYVAHADGSNRATIATSAVKGTQPSLSADGTKVAWTVWQRLRT